ncbi:hypothetical protein [Aliiruegeria haliotis]|nr:hypothetical protein [Aliiruegeria haliotis]
MSHRSWMILAALVAALIALDLAMGWELHIFLGKRFADLIDWLAFWH